MDRLTYKHDDNWCVSGLNGKLVSDKYANYWGEAIDRLAAYENAEEQGRLVILPCTIGQKLYTVNCYGIGEYKIHEGTLCEIKMVSGSSFDFYEHRPDGWCYKIDIEQIGKTIFLSFEEAESVIRSKLLCFK